MPDTEKYLLVANISGFFLCLEFYLTEILKFLLIITDKRSSYEIIVEATKLKLVRSFEKISLQ